MNRLISRILILALMTGALCSTDAFAISKKKKAKAETTQTDTTKTAKKKTSKYDKLVKGKNCVSARFDGNSMAVHKAAGKVYLEIPKKLLGREMVIASTITGTSAPDLASIGYKPNAPMYVKFNLRDSTVLMNESSVLPDFDESNLAMKRALEKNSAETVLSAFKINCWNNDSSSVVIDVSSMFAANYEKLAPLKSGTSSGYNIKATYNSAGLSVEQIKAFEDNVSIETLLNYTVTADYMKLILIKSDQPVTVKVNRTILLLPEKKMRPRMSDTRVGVFQAQRQSMEEGRDMIERYSVLKRWDVQPADTAAWLRGELVEPVKPIVYYLDDAFPELWREPARRGALRWNKAFEAIGLKNVIQVLDFPTDDPSFDPDNLKYSCIRYVPSMTANAMGPSWCDPATGEIINASVIVYNDIIRLVNGWRFIQTSQVDERVRGVKLPDEVVEESIEYVIAHEVGHTLGFMHNMSASAAYDVESLRNPEFTRTHGTTASIMDYARFNYIAQPGDKDVRLTPPELGEYDYWLVEYTYKPVIEARTMREEAAVIEKWADEKAGDPIYRYGRQQTIYRYDPSAMSEDLGNDPLKASDYGIANLQYILAHFDEWMNDDLDPDASIRASRYEMLVKQYDRYLTYVMANIGGIYLTSVKPGTEGRTAKTVDKATQKASLKWVLGHLKDSQWLSDRKLTDKFTMRLETPAMISYYTALELFETSHNVMVCSAIADSPKEAYTLSEWCNDITAEVFANKRNPNAGESILQGLWVDYLLSEATKKSQLVKLGSSTAANISVRSLAAERPELSDMIWQNIDALEEMDREHGFGYVASMMGDDVSFGAPGYGWQGKVNVRTVNNSKELYYAQLLKLQPILKSAAASATGDAKAHFQALLYRINSSLDQK
ncbi:MAG: zinc-dependent metalloprotease [Bacteroidales bacterium]|nr:zinc-dependent metalloprotease [Bacteroidales bacterium]